MISLVTLSLRELVVEIDLVAERVATFPAWSRAREDLVGSSCGPIRRRALESNSNGPEPFRFARPLGRVLVLVVGEDKSPLGRGGTSRVDLGLGRGGVNLDGWDRFDARLDIDSDIWRVRLWVWNSESSEDGVDESRHTRMLTVGSDETDHGFSEPFHLDMLEERIQVRFELSSSIRDENAHSSSMGGKVHSRAVSRESG